MAAQDEIPEYIPIWEKFVSFYLQSTQTCLHSNVNSREKVPISNPLVALLAIGNEKDENDLKSKKQDYIKILFSLNHILGLNVVYKSNDSNNNGDTDLNNDEKQDLTESKVKLNFVKNKIPFNDIKNENYTLLWKSNEILLYF